MRVLSERHKAIEPLRDPGPLSWDDHDDRTPKQARTTSPYQAGDVVKVMDGHEIRDALIVHVSSERCHSWGYRPRYKVRLRRKRDGQWSNTWRLFSPGDIERGFETWDD